MTVNNNNYDPEIGRCRSDKLIHPKLKLSRISSFIFFNSIFHFNFSIKFGLDAAIENPDNPEEPQILLGN